MNRLKAFLLFSVVAILATMVHPAHASGTVTRSNCVAPYQYQSSAGSSGYVYSTPNLACGAGGGTSTGGDSCSGTCSAQTNSHYYASNYSTAVCPANSTGTTSCTCNTGYVPNAGATACVAAVACPAADSSAGAYWIMTGTTPDSIYTAGLGTLCKASCQTYSFMSVPRPAGYPTIDGAYKVVSGVTTYFSFREYAYTGLSCSSGETLPVASTVPVSDTCAPGQSMIQMGTKFRCIDPATGATVSTNSASAVAASTTLGNAATASAVAAAGTAAAAAGLSASGVADAKAMAAAAMVAAGASGGTAPLANLPPNDPLQNFCVQNPASDICKAQTVQAKAAGALPSTGMGSWYTKTYPQGVGGVLTSNFNTLKVTPLAGLINGLVPTFSGAAHNGCFSIEIWHMGTQSICVPPLVMTALGIFMILTALFAARGIVFGG